MDSTAPAGLDPGEQKQQTEQNQAEQKQVEQDPTDQKETEQKQTDPVGKGRKRCPKCSASISSACATCKHCKFEYPFKGRRRRKPMDGTARLRVMHTSHHDHADLPQTAAAEESAAGSSFKPSHSSFMKAKPQFVDIEPKKRQYIDAETIDSYINVSQLLLDCASEQVSKFGDLEGAAKILNRSLKNLTYLATLCDSNDYYGDKCPDLNDFIE